MREGFTEIIGTLASITEVMADKQTMNDKVSAFIEEVSTTPL